MINNTEDKILDKLYDILKELPHDELEIVLDTLKDRLKNNE